MSSAQTTSQFPISNNTRSHHSSEAPVSTDDVKTQVRFFRFLSIEEQVELVEKQPTVAAYFASLNLTKPKSKKKSGKRFDAEGQRISIWYNELKLQNNKKVCDEAIRYLNDGIGLSILTAGDSRQMAINLRRLVGIDSLTKSFSVRARYALLHQFSIWKESVYNEYPNLTHAAVDQRICIPLCGE